MLTHPALVHLPIALAVLMPLLTLALLLSWWRGWLPRRAWWVAVGLQATLVGSSLLALRTGHADGERVEQTRGEAAVEAHEEAAEAFVWVAALGLAVSLAAALLRRESGARFTGAAAVAASLAVLAMGYRTGAAGGQLVYGEGSTLAAPATGGGEHGDHDDDD